MNKKNSKRAKSPQTLQEVFVIQGEFQSDDYDIDQLRKVDFEQVEKLDPSQEDGFKLAFERNIFMKIELDESSQNTLGPMDTSEEILLRVLVKGDTIVPQAIRFELMSELDVQFYY